MELQHYYSFIKTPIGFLQLMSDSESLISLSFSDQPKSSSNNLPDIITKSKIQLEEYFRGTRQIFNINMSPRGTGFQMLVWEQVKNVPFGKTSTYLEIALLTGSKTYTRAVGMANGKNPLPIIIPCHRIIGTNGKLTGYSGGMDRKRWLLQHELKHSKSSGLLF